MTTNTTRQWVDMRVPLTWLLTAAASIMITLGATLWNVSGQTNKLDLLITTYAKLEKRLDDRDTKVDDMRDRMNGFDRTSDNLKLRVDALERRK